MQRSGIAVFDIGGTWFRSGVFTKASGLSHLSKVPAANYKNTPHDNTIELQLKLVDYLVDQVESLKAQGIKIIAASISMGAALNGHTGEILNSGPLWGPNCERFSLLEHVRRRMPEVEWFVLNDVSAALLRFVDEPQYLNARRVNLITVSSGIACRTFDQGKRHIPLNSDGIQGEVGHIPINFSLFGKSITEQCDCGGENHLNAFASGRGMAKVLQRVASTKTLPYANTPLLRQLRAIKNDEHALNTSFLAAVKTGDTAALAILDAITYPIAQMIIHMLTIDAEIEKIIMTGGVVHAVEEQYMKSLLMNLEKIGLYQISDPATFFRNTVTLGINDDNSGLLGGAIAYEGVR